MNFKAIVVGIVTGAMVVAATSMAQTPLPPEARMQVLLVQVDDALARNDNKAALSLFTQIEALKLPRPPGTYMIEAKLAGQEKDYARSMRTLEAYFRVSNSSHPDYQEAARLYATLEGMQKEVDAKAAAAKAGADAARAQAEARAAEAAAAAKAKADAEKAQQAALLASQRRAGSESFVASAPARQKAAADDAGLSITFRDCANCPEMVVLPAGTTLMEGPNLRTTTVTLGSFAISKFEVTWDEWQQCVRERGCNAAAQEKRGGDEGWGRGRRPVVNVDHDEATDFVEWLSRKTKKTYKLPSESQWQYAAIGESPTNYPWGDDQPVCDPALPNSAAVQGCPTPEGADRSFSVGSFPANMFGLHDMVGNVYEPVEEPCVMYSPLSQWMVTPPADGSAHTRISKPVGKNGCYELRAGRSFADGSTPALLHRSGSFGDPVESASARFRKFSEGEAPPGTPRSSQSGLDHWDYRDTGIRVARAIH